MISENIRILEVIRIIPFLEGDERYAPSLDQLSPTQVS